MRRGKSGRAADPPTWCPRDNNRAAANKCQIDAILTLFGGGRAGIASMFATLFSSRCARKPAAANDWQDRSRFEVENSRHGTQLESILRVSTECATVPAIDMRSIKQLAEGDEMGVQFIADIIDVFLADLNKRVSAIGSHMSRGDRGAVAATAHAIKGSCSHFGAVSLIELSSELEHRAKREPSSDLHAAIDSMIKETERVRTALEAYRAEHARS